MGETDPREEIVEKALFEAMHIYKWPATPDMWRARARAILAALDAARPVEPLDEIVARKQREIELSGIAYWPINWPIDGRRVRHRKRGGTYTVLGEANVQTGEPLGDDAWVVVYRADHNGRLWVRPKREFEDGRFEEIAYDATDAIDRAIANWSTISDDPPADEEVAREAFSLRNALSDARRDASNWRRLHDEQEATIERLSAEVARLYDDNKFYYQLLQKHVQKAGDACRRATAAEAEVADLRAKLATAGEALEPFAAEAAHWEGHAPGEQLVEQFDDYEGELKVSDLRRARTALDAIKEDRT